MNIRDYQPADQLRIWEIYRPFVVDSHISFEYEVPSPEALNERFLSIQQDYPVLVLEQDSFVIGYACAGRFRSRKAYDRCAETSIYLDRNHRSVGHGSALYRELFSRLQQLNMTTLFAVITLPNPNSIAFHKKLGFQEFGRTDKTGFKMDQWWGICWMVKYLDENGISESQKIG